MKSLLMLLCLAVPAHSGLLASGKKKVKAPEATLLDDYIRSATANSEREKDATPGAIWSGSARLNDLGRDLRASQIDDVVTVLVSESVNAVATGASTTERASSANASISQLAGKKSVAGALSNLAGLSGDQKLNGTGTTSRTATLTATLTARVVGVLPGGLLVIEGDKRIEVNSEQQTITIRGVVRTADISTANTVPSAQVGDMEVRVNGKGVVGDAVRRPNLLYRLLLGILPF
ncbi:MAG: flagellar basal body L-ring protein FlgH [Terriglobia bacterium]